LSIRAEQAVWTVGSSALSDIENQTDWLHAVQVGTFLQFTSAHFCTVHFNRYSDGTVKSLKARGTLPAVTSSTVIKKVQIAEYLETC